MVKLLVKQYENQQGDEIKLQINDEEPVLINQNDQIIEITQEMPINVKVLVNGTDLLIEQQISNNEQEQIVLNKDKLSLIIVLMEPEPLQAPEQKAIEENQEEDSSEPALNNGDTQENSDKSCYNLSTINDVPHEDTDEADIEHLNTQTIQASDDVPGNEIQIYKSVKGNTLYFYQKFEQITNLPPNPTIDQILNALLNFESDLISLELDQKDTSSSIQLHRNFQNSSKGTD